MPSNPRQAIKQTLTSAQNEIQKAMDKVTGVGMQFEKDHPDYYEGFCQIVAGLSQLKDAVNKMSDAI